MHIVNSPPSSSPCFKGCRRHCAPCRALVIQWSLPSDLSTCAAAPLLDALIARVSQPDVALHVPGHKHGRGVLERFKLSIGADPLRYDLTEISGLDNLSAPCGVIEQAQQLAAEAFGADRSWFLVNGCSSGIHAGVMACAGPGATLLVARNCHLSVFSAMVMSGCRPWWVGPELDQHYGIAHGVQPEALRQAFQQALAHGRQVKGAIVVSPTYFGAVAPIKELADICHEYGVPLLVDEAHGSHFGTHPLLPPSAMSQGADSSMHSTHKVLSAMTQAAMLHVRGPLMDPLRVSRSLQVLQTSSPSYLLLASLDAARAVISEPSFMQEPLEAAKHACRGLSAIHGVEILNLNDMLGSASGSTSNRGEGQSPARIQDPLRLTLRVTGLGLSGFEAATRLEREHSVVVELATAQVVVCALGPGTRMSDARALVSAFRAISVRQHQQQLLSGGSGGPGSTVPSGSGSGAHSNSADWDAVSAAALPPRDAFFAPSIRMATSEAVGRVCAELLCPYPPGVPVLCPGEQITAAALRQLQAALDAGGVVTGASDSTLQTILTVATEGTVGPEAAAAAAAQQRE